MTAYINEDGTLGITQIINSYRTADGLFVKNEYAVSSVLLVDIGGNQITNYDSLLSNAATRAYGGLDSVMVYASHTAYYYEQLAQHDDGKLHYQAKLSHMETTLTYGSNAFSASRLVQSFTAQQNHFDVLHEGSKTTVNPVAGTLYKYEPDGTKWYWSAETNNSVWGGGIITNATVYIANSSLNFTLETKVEFFIETSHP